jgi:hypothetical protein
VRAIVAFLGTTIAALSVDVAPAAGQPASAPAEAKPPAPDPTPTPKPPRLRLDLDRHVDAVVKRHDDGKLRFEDRIEVTARAQEALEALLRGAELACSPSSDGPPPTSELNRYKTVPIPPYADFIAAAKAIFKALKKINPWKGEPRYVLYGVRRGDELRFLVREGELSLSLRLAVPGTTWDEIARFHDRGEAATALRRLERGFETLARQTPGEPPHPSMSIKCLPP